MARSDPTGQPASHRLALLAGAAGGAVGAVGLFVALGWLLHRPLWVQVRPDLAPTQFNTALSLLFLGAALVARSSDKLPRLRWLAAVPAAIAGLTLAQYLVGIDLGIDQLFVRSELLVDTSHPGRMAPETAILLLLAASALLSRPGQAFSLAAVAAPVITLAAVPLLGYMAGIERFLGDRSVTHMSLLTAVAGLLLGVGLVALGFRRRRVRREEGGWRTPLVASVATVLVTLLFWQALERREAAQVQEVLEATAERLGSEMQIRLDARRETLELVASLWELQAEPGSEAWHTDTRLVLDRYPELRVVEWLDLEGEVEWRWPEGADPLPAAEDAALRRRLKESRSTGRPVAEEPSFLSGGGSAFRLFLPLSLPGGRAGYLAGLFRIDELMADIVEDVAALYFVRVESDGQELFEHRVPEAEELFAWSRELVLPVPGDLAWSLTVRPSNRLLPARGSRLTVMILVAGVSLALLLTIALRLRQTAVARAQDLVRANRSLTSEIEKLRRAEEEIRRLNAELEARVAERTDELARSNEDLKQFASFISHELRQPLNSIALWTDLLKTTNGEALNEKGRRYLEEIRSAVQRLGDLISGQLALSDLSAKESRNEPVDLRRVVDDLSKDLDSTLRQAGARLEVDALPVLRGDPRQLYQLLRNLVDNAVKYRRPEEPLRIHIWSEPPSDGRSGHGGDCRILVEDNGRGFPSDAGERIFRLFERLDPEAGQGSGMGLAICQRVVERLGGRLTAEGRPGSGATFVISVPASRIAREPAA